MKWLGWIMALFFLLATAVLVGLGSDQARLAQKQNSAAVAAKQTQIQETLKRLETELAESQANLEKAARKNAELSARKKTLETQLLRKQKRKAELLRKKQALQAKLQEIEQNSVSSQDKIEQLRRAVDLEKTRIRALKAQLARVLPK